MKEIKITLSIEPWDNNEEDPDGLEEEVTITEEIVREYLCVGYYNIKSLERCVEATLEELNEVIGDILDGIVPDKYKDNYSWDFFTVNEAYKLENFVRPIAETEFEEWKLEQMRGFLDGAEFVETKEVDGIAYAYYRVPLEDIFD